MREVFIVHQNEKTPRVRSLHDCQWEGSLQIYPTPGRYLSCGSKPFPLFTHASRPTILPVQHKAVRPSVRVTFHSPSPPSRIFGTPSTRTGETMEARGSD